MSDDGRIRSTLTFERGETVSERVKLPSALWALIDDATDDDETVEEWLIRQASTGLRLGACEQSWIHAQADVELDAAAWERIRLRTLESLQHSQKDPGLAFADVVNEFVQTSPNIVVDGETKGLEDVAEWLGEEDGDG